MAKDAVYTWRDPAKLAGAVIVWLYLDMASAVLDAVSAYLNLAELAGYDPDASKDMALASDLFRTPTAIFVLITTAVCGFLILRWTYRVSRNAHAAASGLRTSPPWAVGWYFVPFATLWKPFQALREVWQVARDPQNWRAVPTPALLRWWWGLWLLSSALGQLTFRISLRADTLGDLGRGDMVDMLIGVVSIPLNLILIRIVHRLTAMQAEPPAYIAPAVEPDHESFSGDEVTA